MRRNNGKTTPKVRYGSILLAPGGEGVRGWHSPGFVTICAWDRDVETCWSQDFAEAFAEEMANKLWDDYFAAFGW